MRGVRKHRRDVWGGSWSSVKSVQGLGHATSHFTTGETEVRESQAVLQTTEGGLLWSWAHVIFQLRTF